MRLDGRTNDELRETIITRHFLKYAEGSALIQIGNTKVLCAASVEESVPFWRKGEQRGWITAEYALLPRSTHSRTARESVRGRQSGRTSEIQRLIGRCLRAVVKMEALGERTIRLDCDVLQADGGTRTAAITGAFVALADALDFLYRERKIKEFPLTDYIAAISAGQLGGDVLLDLSFEEDSKADVDMNIVMTGKGELVEIQGTAEKKPFSREVLDKILALGEAGIQKLISRQRQSLGEVAARIGSGEKSLPLACHDKTGGGSPPARKTLLLATHNEGKVLEIKKMFLPFSLVIYSLKDFPQLPAVEETGSSFKENAVLKAETICRLTGKAVLADDSGLEVGYLEGKPGIFSARFAGQNASDEENNAYLMQLMENAPPDQRKARFVCAMALAVPGQQTAVVEGTCEGAIAATPRGSNGFGYDPLFIHGESGKTFGEIDRETKNRISHRHQALQKMLTKIKENLGH